MKKLLVEFLGTFFLASVAIITGNPLAIGLTLMAMIYTFGHISGGHFNPAVTLAVWFRSKMELKTLIAYFISQALGAFAASAAAFYVFTPGRFFFNSIREGAFLNALSGELIFTFVFCSLILAVTTADKLKGSAIYGFSIGLTLTGSILACAGISGGVLNPAIGNGSLLFSILLGGATAPEGALSSNLLFTLYFFGPLVGAVLAGLVNKVLSEDGLPKLVK